MAHFGRAGDADTVPYASLTVAHHDGASLDSPHYDEFLRITLRQSLATNATVEVLKPHTVTKVPLTTAPDGERNFLVAPMPRDPFVALLNSVLDTMSRADETAEYGRCLTASLDHGRRRRWSSWQTQYTRAPTRADATSFDAAVREIYAATRWAFARTGQDMTALTSSPSSSYREPVKK